MTTAGWGPEPLGTEAYMSISWPLTVSLSVKDGTLVTSIISLRSHLQLVRRTGPVDQPRQGRLPRF